MDILMGILGVNQVAVSCKKQSKFGRPEMEKTQIIIPPQMTA